MTKLFLAEGDFSYSSTQAGPLVASGLDSPSTVLKKYGPSTSSRLAAMSTRPGVTLAHGVDATLPMHRGALPAEARGIESIEIRYPHTGFKSVARNRSMLRSMISSCSALMSSPLCAEGCVLEVSLKTTGRYNEWAGDVTSVARGVGLALRSVGRPRVQEGYEHVRTNPKRKPEVRLDQACTYVFQRKVSFRGGWGANKENAHTHPHISSGEGFGSSPSPPSSFPRSWITNGTNLPPPGILLGSPQRLALVAGSRGGRAMREVRGLRQDIQQLG